MLLVARGLFTFAEAAAKTAAAAAWSICAWTCFVHHEDFSHKVGTIKVGNRLAGSSFIRHFNEAETTAALRKLV